MPRRIRRLFVDTEASVAGHVDRVPALIHRNPSRSPSRSKSRHTTLMVRNPRSSESGAVTVLIAVFVLLTALLVLRVAGLGGAAASRARAQTAADAAALAGVVDGREGADALAIVNGGEVVGWRDDGDEVQVTVRLDDAIAVARAERRSTPPFG